MKLERGIKKIGVLVILGMLAMVALSPTVAADDLDMADHDYVGKSGGGRIIFHDETVDVFEFSSANFGIGISSPNNPLDIRSTSTQVTSPNYGSVQFGVQGGSGRIQLTDDGGTNWQMDALYGDLRIFRPGELAMLIRNNGEVGINTTTPDRALEIINGSSPQLRLTHEDSEDYTDFQTTSNGYLYVNPSGGRIGIGTSSPDAGLDVQQSITAASGSAKGVNIVQTIDAVSGGDKLYGLYIEPDFDFNGQSTNNYAIYAKNEETYGNNYGIWVESGQVGIFGWGKQWGVKGLSDRTVGTAIGVEGEADGINSGTNIGVYGKASGATTAANNIGVQGSGPLNGYDFKAVGAGTNYGSFTGAHDVKLSDNFPENITAGMIVSVTGETMTRYVNETKLSWSCTLPTVKLADTSKDSSIFGVITNELHMKEDDWFFNQSDEGDRFGIINALGEGRVWVTDIGGEIEAGDYITSSEIIGYGQKQDNDILRSYTVGKAIEDVDWSNVTETVDFDGKSYKTYPIAVVYTSG